MVQQAEAVDALEKELEERVVRLVNQEEVIHIGNQ
jgi:hypothetical protein